MRHDSGPTTNQRALFAAGAIQVSRDMESIFGAAAHRTAGPTLDPVVPIVKAAGTKPHSWLWPVALAVLAGLLIAGGAAWMTLQDVVRPAAPRAAAPVQVATRTALAPAMRPPAPAVQRQAARVTQLSAIAPATAAKPAAIAPRHQARARPQRIGTVDRDSLNERFDSRIRASRMYPQIAAADRELREAYARAEFVGLDPKLLRIFRDRWWQVRKDVEPDPAYAIEAYYQLARELDAARRRS
jgi:hypothetical protein